MTDDSFEHMRPTMPATPDLDPVPTVRIDPRYQLAVEIIRCVRLRDTYQRIVDKDKSAFDWRPRIGRILAGIEAAAFALARDDPPAIARSLRQLQGWEN